jgi:hypothetical protein
MCTVFYPCAAYIAYIEIRFMFSVTQCSLPYFCESPFVSHICIHFSLLQAGIQHELFNWYLTPQACKWQFLPIRPQCCLKCNVTWNQYTTVLSGGKFKYSIVTACNNCFHVLLTEYRNWFKCAVEAFSWIYGKCYLVSVMYHLPECKGKGRFVPMHCMKAYGCMAPLILKLGSWWGWGCSWVALLLYLWWRADGTHWVGGCVGHSAFWGEENLLSLIIFHAFSSVVRQMPGYNPQRWGTAPHSSKIFVLLYILFVLCRSVYRLCVNVYCATATGWQPNCS